MKSLLQIKTLIPAMLLTLVLTCFGLLPQLQAVSPAPDGCYAGFTTAEGCNALNVLTTGAGNTGIGWRSLYFIGAGNFNTGVGAGTLVLNTADSNTAVGAAAMLLNTGGTLNTAVGTDALVHNSNSNQNTAVGAFALFSNQTGLNTAVGYQALFANVGGLENTAMGDQALLDNTGGFFNVAVGGAALLGNVTGNDNTACGGGALTGSTGDDNTAIGFQAGINATSGSNNVYIGSGMGGVAGESNACYIASIFGQTSANGMPILINSFNKLGTTTSSKRFKDEIKPMDKASKALFALKPVSFRYKKEIDPAGISQLGLVAEDVEKVNPDLVVRDKEGKPYSVRYDQVNAMLLNEFLNEHRAFVEEQRKVEQQQKEIDVLKADLKEQRSLIQKVNDRIELSSSTPQVVASDQ
jgi:hypothetical protein